MPTEIIFTSSKKSGSGLASGAFRINNAAERSGAHVVGLVDDVGARSARWAGSGVGWVVMFEVIFWVENATESIFCLTSHFHYGMVNHVTGQTDHLRGGPRKEVNRSRAKRGKH